MNFRGLIFRGPLVAEPQLSDRAEWPTANDISLFMYNLYAYVERSSLSSCRECGEFQRERFVAEIPTCSQLPGSHYCCDPVKYGLHT